MTDNGDGTLTFATPEAEFTATKVGTPGSNNITTYFTPFGARTNMGALIAETDDVRAVAILNENGFDVAAGMAVDPSAGGFIERMTETALPSGGSVEYMGAYLSRIGRADSPSTLLYIGSITGNVSLTADFAASQVSGAITDRVDGLNASYEDIIIGAGTIVADGTFSGSVTGGEMTDGGRTIVTAGTGNYSAVFGGANGEDIVGGLVLSQQVRNGTFPSEDLTEFGVFHAAQ